MYGTVSWLNALDEIGKIKKGIDLVCTLFVFKAGIVLLAQERTKGKKKPKVSLCMKRSLCIQLQDNVSKENVHTLYINQQAAVFYKVINIINFVSVHI